MPYEISAPDEGTYALIKWTGPVTPDEIKDSGVRGIGFVAERGISKILVDIADITNRLSMTDLFLTTNEHSRLGPPRPQCALLGRPDQQRELSFVETVAYNRGMRLKAFTEEEDAIAWLRKGVVASRAG